MNYNITYPLRTADSISDVFKFLDRAFDYNLDDYSASYPPANVFVDTEDSSLNFEFAVAGYSPNEIEILFSGDSLEINSLHEATEEERSEEQRKKFFKKKIAKRSFRLKYSLAPGKLDTEKAEAIFENGLLKIKIPRDESSKPKRLSITQK